MQVFRNCVYIRHIGTIVHNHISVAVNSHYMPTHSFFMALEKIINHDGEMFGAVRRECGNYKNLDLDAAKREAKRYLAALDSREQDFKYKGETI